MLYLLPPTFGLDRYIGRRAAGFRTQEGVVVADVTNE
jgi:hypothetical protein